MASTDKLEYLLETKRLIKAAIKSKGIAVGDNVTFREYAELIGRIESGNATGTSFTNIISGDLIFENGFIISDVPPIIFEKTEE